MARGDGHTDLVVFRNLASELESPAQFEFRVAIVSESERSKPGSKEKICIEEERILVDNFTFVAAL